MPTSELPVLQASSFLVSRLQSLSSEFKDISFLLSWKAASIHFSTTQRALSHLTKGYCSFKFHVFKVKLVWSFVIADTVLLSYDLRDTYISPHVLRTMVRFRCLGDNSISLEAWGAVFRSQDMCKNSGVLVIALLIPELGRSREMDSWGLLSY